MTEKQFYRNRGTIWENNKSMSLEEVEDKLNEQHDEIIELREAMKRLMMDMMTR